ncbi:hypothetical protein Tco_1397565, partial [Tanacetum coccineum]
NSGEGSSQRRETSGGQSSGSSGAYGRLTKVEFSKFDGENVQGWLYRVNKYKGLKTKQKRSVGKLSWVKFLIERSLVRISAGRYYPLYATSAATWCHVATVHPPYTAVNNR